ncbi:MAG: A24 family peptidase [Rothia sp. (in: high G+C Gram-positive bacteria)]|nr:A24 family peptidase [Rothia sp. (in: high G+C Gram-positive bacteria)]
MGLILQHLEAGFGQGQWRSLLSALLLVWVLSCYLVVAYRLSVIDVREHRLPNRLVFPLYAQVGAPLCIVALLGESPCEDTRTIAYGGALMLGFYGIMRLASRGALGLGDVKLAGVLGMLLGFFSLENLLWGNLLIFLLGGITAIALVISRKATAKTHIAFGPFMLLGTLLAVLLPAT